MGKSHFADWGEFMNASPTKSGQKGTRNRVVNIYIIDKSKEIPIKERLISALLAEVTDLADDEIKMSLDIPNILEEYNKRRTKIQDQVKSEQLGKEIFLGPATVKDLSIIIDEQIAF